MKKNQTPTLSSVRTPALGLLAALALAFGAPRRCTPPTSPNCCRAPARK